MFGRKKTRRARLERQPAGRQRRPAGAEPQARAAEPAYRAAAHRERIQNDGNTGRLRPGQAPPKNRAANMAANWRQLGRRTGVLILIIAIIVSVANVLAVSPNAKIETLTSSEASSAFLRNSNEYQAAANQLLKSSILNRNKITINTDEISRQLVARFPELTGASVTLSLLKHRPTVYVQPAEAALVVAANNGAFVVDQNGRALMPSANLPTARNLPQVVDQSGLPARLTKQVLTSDDVQFIQDVLAQLKAKRIGVSSMVLPAQSRELDVYIDGKPYFVKFNLANDDARQQTGTYLATVAELQRGKIAPKQYIDVRVDGRAYYK